MKRRTILSVQGFIVSLLALVAVQGTAAQQPGVFEVMMPGRVLLLEIPDTGGRTVGEAVGSITAFADGEQCASVDVSTATGDVILELGLPGQPSACSREGAIVIFQDRRGDWLDMQLTVQPGSRATLNTFATTPCTTDPCFTPGPSPTTGFTPTPPISVPATPKVESPIQPPDTGSGGLANG